MQKKIIALAIAAVFAAPVAMADTANVNIYGTLDAGVRSNTTKVPNIKDTSATTFSSGAFTANRWGFKGSEDLGDGMKAFWHLESSLNLGAGGSGQGATAQGSNIGGNALFDRGATLGVSSGANAIELGRQRIVAHKVAVAIEPMGMKFRNQSNSNTLLYSYTGNASRQDNLVSYTGTFGPVKVLADRNIPANGTNDSATTSVGVVFESGPLNVTGVYANANIPTGTLDDTTYYLVGAAYKIGDGKVSGGLTKNTIDSATIDGVTENQFIGGSYNVSPKVGVLGGYYINTVNTAGSAVETETTRLVLGATYALSKRTTAYGQVDTRTTEVAGVETNKQNGFSVGLATTF